MNRWIILGVVGLVVIAGIGMVGAKDNGKQKVAKQSYKLYKQSEDVLKIFKEMFGIELPSDYIEVVVNDRLVAKIPEDSKFIGLDVHDVCLEYQYGTAAWYKCEVPLNEK